MKSLFYLLLCGRLFRFIVETVCFFIVYTGVNRLQNENLCYNKACDLSIRKGQMREWNVDGNEGPFSWGSLSDRGSLPRPLAAQWDRCGGARGEGAAGGGLPAILYQRSFSNANGRK